MKKFEVTIKPNFEIIIEIEAKNKQEAIDIVNEYWKNGELDFNYDYLNQIVIDAIII